MAIALHTHLATLRGIRDDVNQARVDLVARDPTLSDAERARVEHLGHSVAALDAALAALDEAAHVAPDAVFDDDAPTHIV